MTNISLYSLKKTSRAWPLEKWWEERVFHLAWIFFCPLCGAWNLLAFVQMIFWTFWLIFFLNFLALYLFFCLFPIALVMVKPLMKVCCSIITWFVCLSTFYSTCSLFNPLFTASCHIFIHTWNARLIDSRNKAGYRWCLTTSPWGFRWALRGRWWCCGWRFLSNLFGSIFDFSCNVQVNWWNGSLIHWWHTCYILKKSSRWGKKQTKENM